jgi:L-fuculose-phosphate aldolase
VKNSLISSLKKTIILIARLVWDSGLVSACSGNISLRVDPQRILITATGTSFCFLKPEDIVLLNIKGQVLEGGIPSSESKLHLAIYRRFPAVNAVLHTHTTCANAFFLDRPVFKPSTFEAECLLGEVRGVAQRSINVEDTRPVVKELGKNQIVALRRHGVVSVGKELKTCFFKIQTLEEQVKIELYRRIFVAREYKTGRQKKRREHG